MILVLLSQVWDMLAADGDRHDFTIHWPATERRRIPGILRAGICPAFCVPRRARPRALVGVVAEDGTVLLLFTLQRIEEHVSGNFRCRLFAVPGTMRRPAARDVTRLPVNRHGLGAVFYFDAKSRRPVFFTPPEVGAAQPGVLTLEDREPRFYPVLANNVAKTLSQSERELVADYTRWIGRPEIFGHRYLRGPRLFTDLFIRPKWALVEAKVHTDRDTLRTALGQLLDYQRYFPRRPRLAVLLPARPPVAMRELFEAKRVAVVWRSRGSAFTDSVDGHLSSLLRA